MKNRFLTEQEIKQMAEWAVKDYEFSCSWKSAFYSAAEFAVDEFGVRATKSQAATAVNMAKLIWEGYCIEARREIDKSKQGR
tara:strand:- start:353 stop:598 length:246 start_codon:yes stop_codon:yes gene_type:complete